MFIVHPLGSESGVKSSWMYEQTAGVEFVSQQENKLETSLS